jgi:hypothetical protein
MRMPPWVTARLYPTLPWAELLPGPNKPPFNQWAIRRRSTWRLGGSPGWLVDDDSPCSSRPPHPWLGGRFVPNHLACGPHAELATDGGTRAVEIPGVGVTAAQAVRDC